MHSKDYTIKVATLKEINLAVDWAAQEGWNPGLHDADCYYCADSQGFLIGYLGSEPIATLSAVKYSDTFGFLGFYIVKPEYRAQGYGFRIWQRGLEYLRGCNIGLDGVMTQQDNYRKSGFELAFRNIRYQGFGGGEFPTQAQIVQLSSLPFASVVAYTRPFFPTDRSRFLKVWINQPQSMALGIRQAEKLVGYGVCRACRVGYKIGPLFADSPELAELLLLSFKSQTQPSEPIYLDVPEVNHAAITLARRQHLNPVFETARMYTKSNPALPFARLFGITSFEVG